MSDFMKLLVSLSISGTVVILALLILRSIFKTTVSNRWRYYAWLIVFARLLLPVTLPDSPVGSLFAENPSAAVFEERVGAPVITAETAVRADPAVTDTTATDSPPFPSAHFPAIPLPTILFAVWGVAALVLFARKAAQYLGFTRCLRAESRPPSDPSLLERYAKVCATAKVVRPPELLISPLSSTPMLVGLANPFIALPAHVADVELETVLLHELVHHKRRDALYKWFSQTALCLHWFNPMVWLAVREFERDCELSCDEAVLALLPPDDYRCYGDALLHAVRTDSGCRTRVARLALGEDAKQLKERLDVIMNYRKRTRLEKTLAVCLTLALCAGTVAVGAYAADTPPDLPATPQAKSSPATADAATPEGTIELAMRAIKAVDIDSLCRYSNNPKSSLNGFYINDRTNWKFKKQNGSILFGGNDYEQNKLYHDIARSLSWKIGKTDISGNTAKIELQITNRDFGDIVAEIVSNSLLAAASDSPVDYDDEDAMKKLMQAVPESETVTLSITAVVQKNGGKWRLQIDDMLANAICGNLMDGTESPESKAKIDAASEKLDEYVAKSLDRDALQREAHKDIMESAAKQAESAMEDAAKQAEAAMEEARESIRDAENEIRELQNKLGSTHGAN